MENTVSDLIQGKLPSKLVEKLQLSKRRKDSVDQEPPPVVVKPSSGRCCKFLRKIRAAILVFTAATGIPTFYLSYYMIAKPAVETLRADLQPASCAIVVSDLRIGRSNCSWSSCVEGCTSSLMFKCRQILVYFEKNTNLSVEIFSHYNFSESIDSELDLQASELGKNIAKLQVNVLGCGYEPCEEWYKSYLHRGYAFQCFVSEDGLVAVPHHDNARTMLEVLIGTSPLILGLTAVFLCYIIYCRKGSTDDTLSLTPDPEILKQKQEEARIKLLMKMTEESATSHLDLKMLMDLSKAAATSGSASKTPSISGPSGHQKVKSKSALRRWRRAFKRLKENHFILYDPRPLSTNSVHPLRRNDSETSFSYTIHPVRLNGSIASFNNAIHPLRTNDSISSFSNTLHPLRLNDYDIPYYNSIHPLRTDNSSVFSNNLKFPVKTNDALPISNDPSNLLGVNSLQYEKFTGEPWCERSPSARLRSSSDYVYDPATAIKYST